MGAAASTSVDLETVVMGASDSDLEEACSGLSEEQRAAVLSTLCSTPPDVPPDEWLAAWPAVDIDTPDAEGWSALLRAAEGGAGAVTELLLRQPGVRVNAVEPGKRQSALFLASRLGHEGVVRALLACPDVDVNQAAMRGYSPLCIAAEMGQLSVVRLLLAHAGVDANLAKEDGCTPLYVAAHKGYAGIVKCLLAQEGVDANRPRKSGATPLYVAAQNGDMAVVRLLLSHAGIDAKLGKDTRKGEYTPLYIASHKSHKAVVRQLLAHMV